MRTLRYALIGCPLGHSLSPAIHAALFELSGVTAEYSLMTIQPDRLDADFSELKELDGFNVTIPHKIPIIAMCDRLDGGAARYGAVNCVKTDGGITGFNTDVYGFTKSIQILGASLSGSVLLLGCGGVGRMMAIETALCGGRLTIAARNPERADAVRREILQSKPDAEVTVTTPDELRGESFELVMNSTPVGMYPNSECSPLDISRLCGVKYAFDVIYNPTETLFLREAAARGIKTLNGLPMLVMQAAMAHKIWYGAAFSQRDIDAVIKKTEGLIR